MILLAIAARNLLQARMRTGLLGAAIALVTGMLVLLMALSRGISDNLVEAATTVSAGHVNVAGFYKPTAGTAIPIVTGVAQLRADVEQLVPDSVRIIERDRGWGKLVSETGAVQVGLSGLVAEDEGELFDRLRVARESDYVDGGRDEVIGDPRDIALPGTVILFVNQAKRLGVRVGDVVTITTETQSGATNTADVRVVAVAKDLGLLSSFAVFVPKQVVLDLYRLNDDTTGALWVYLDDIGRADEVLGVVRAGLVERGYNVRDHEPLPFFFKFETVRGEDWTGQQIDVTIWRDEVSFLTWILTGFDVLSILLVGILVGIIAVGVMNSMWNAVRERTKEIGTLRAIGMTRFAVLRLFMIEAMLLGLGGSLAGALIAAGVALAVDAAGVPIASEAAQAVLLSDELNLSVGAAWLVVSVVALTSFTTLAAAIPALRAALLRPVVALSHAE
jgi:putative ABC transport system permease protein